MSITEANWLLALVCGSRRVNLLNDPDAGGWRLAEYGASLMSRETIHTSGNAPRGGGLRTGVARDNVRATLSCHLFKQSGLAALQRNVQDVYQFITHTWLFHDVGKREPVYLERRLDGGYSGTGERVVLFGRGALYHEIMGLEGLRMPGSGYGAPLTNLSAATIKDVEISLSLLPYAVGKPTFVGEATGWVRFDNDGAVETWLADTQFCPNPGFEHATFDTAWTSSHANLTAALSTERVRTGFQAARLTSVDTAVDRTYTFTTTLGGAFLYTLSMYVYKDGTAPTNADMQLWVGDAGGSAAHDATIVADPDHPGWYRAYYTFTADAVARTEGIVVKPGKVLIIDDVQLIVNSWPGPCTMEGAMLGPGVVWTGTEHNSAQTRAAGQLRYRTSWTAQAGYETIYYGKGAIVCWVKTPWVGNDGWERTILDTGQSTTQNRILLAKTSANFLRLRLYGSTAAGYKHIALAVDGTNWPADTWLCIVATWDETGPTGLYLYGATAASSTVVTTSGTWTSLNQLGGYMYVGSNMSAATQFNGLIADLRIFGPDAVVTPADLYAANRGKGELPFIWTKTIGGQVQSTKDADYDNEFWVGNLPGDLPPLLRLFVHNDSATALEAWLGFNRFAIYPYRLNVLETVGEFYPAGGSKTTTVSAARSGDSYERINATAYSSSLEAQTDARLAAMFRGTYTAYYVVRDGSATPGMLKWYAATANNVSADITGWSKLITSPTLSMGVAAEEVSFWHVVEAGSLPLPHQDAWLGWSDQAVPKATLATYFMCLGLYGTGLGGAANIDTDYVVFMPADHLVYIPSITGNYVAVLDQLRGGQAFLSIEGASSDIAQEVSSAVTYKGPILELPPHAWTFGNALTDRAAGADQTPADALKLFMIYQPVILWGR